MLITFETQPYNLMLSSLVSEFRRIISVWKKYVFFLFLFIYFIIYLLLLFTPLIFFEVGGIK